MTRSAFVEVVLHSPQRGAVKIQGRRVGPAWIMHLNGGARRKREVGLEITARHEQRCDNHQRDDYRESAWHFRFHRIPVTYDNSRRTSAP